MHQPAARAGFRVFLVALGTLRVADVVVFLLTDGE